MRVVMILFLVVIGFSGCSGCKTNSDVEYIYYGYKFSIPLWPKIIFKPNKDNDNSLIFIYKTGKNYNFLSFDQVPLDYFKDMSCDQVTFFNDAFSGASNSTCSKENLEMFSKIFFEMHNAKKGSYKKDDLTVNFLIADRQSSLFICKNGKSIVRVDANFLSEQDLKAVVKYIQ